MSILVTRGGFVYVNEGGSILISGEVLETLIAHAGLFKGNKVGFMIEAMERFFGHEELLPEVRGFVVPYLESEVNVVARKARRVLKRMPA